LFCPKYCAAAVSPDAAMTRKLPTAERRILWIVAMVARKLAITAPLIT
jgi:hypothetical protein